MKTTALYGGTFNPVHFGHIRPILEAKAILELDRVIWIPNARSPLKSGRGLATADQRLAMLDVALADYSDMQTSDFEVSRAGASFTIDTVTHFKEQLSEDHLIFIIGEDSLETLGQWREIDRLLELIPFYVLGRPGAKRPDTHSDQALLERVQRLETPLLDISSTEIRQRVREGKCIKELVPAGVQTYIAANGLYRD